MTELYQQEWRSEIAANKYPFIDSATLINSHGDVFPEALFNDIVLYPIGATANLYIYMVIVEPSLVTIQIADSNSVVCNATIEVTTTYDDLTFVDDSGRPVGYALCSREAVEILKGWSVGDHRFNVDQTEFCANVCIPTPELGVRSIKLPDDSSFYGDVVMVAEDGVTLEYDAIDGTIQVNAIGEPFFQRLACNETGGSVNDGPFLKTITVDGATLTPDSSGIVNIDVAALTIEDTMLRLDANGSGLRLYIISTNN